MIADHVYTNRHESLKEGPLPAEELLTKTGHYIESRIELAKYKAVDKSSDILSSMLYKIMLGVVSVIFFLMMNIGLALFLGDITGKLYYGFFITGGFYMITGIVIMIFARKMIIEPVKNFIINKVLN